MIIIPIKIKIITFLDEDELLYCFKFLSLLLFVELLSFFSETQIFDCLISLLIDI